MIRMGVKYKIYFDVSYRINWVMRKGKCNEMF
jgi:hypothetical protein